MKMKNQNYIPPSFLSQYTVDRERVQHFKKQNLISILRKNSICQNETELGQKFVSTSRSPFPLHKKQPQQQQNKYKLNSPLLAEGKGIKKMQSIFQNKTLTNFLNRIQMLNSKGVTKFSKAKFQSYKSYNNNRQSITKNNQQQKLQTKSPAKQSKQSKTHHNNSQKISPSHKQQKSLWLKGKPVIIQTFERLSRNSQGGGEISNQLSSNLTSNIYSRPITQPNQNKILELINSEYNSPTIKIPNKVIEFNGYQSATKAIQDSLEQLDIEYIDLMLTHWPGNSIYSYQDPQNAEVRKGTWRALQEGYKSGKIKSIGVSNFRPRHLEELAKYSEVKPVCNQFELHPLYQQMDTIEYCEKNKIQIVAYCSLMRMDDRIVKNQTVLEIAKNHQRSVGEILLRWALAHEFTIIPKSSNPERQLINLRVMDFELSGEQVKAIDQLNKMEKLSWNPQNVS